MKVQCEVSAFLTGNVEIEETEDGTLVCRVHRQPGLSVNPVVHFVVAEGNEELTQQQKSIIVLSATGLLLEAVVGEVHKQLNEVDANVTARTKEERPENLS